jgi:two-component system, LytTR family, response regulator
MGSASSASEGGRAGRALSVVIADDEVLARRGVRAVIEARGGCRVVAEAETGSEAREAILRTRPDLVLVDVQMPGGTGLDVLRSLPPDERPVTVFITAYDSYAVDAFGVRAADYVLKPFTDARLLEAIDRARESHAIRAGAIGPPPVGRSVEHLMVRSIGRTDLVRVADLIRVEAVGYYARLHTSRAILLHRETLDSLAERLDPAVFVRVHRSAIVRLDAIRQVRKVAPTGRYEVVVGGAAVAVSRRGWQLLRSRMALGRPADPGLP